MVKLYLAVSLFLLWGCIGSETALSQFNQGMGSKCAYYSLKSAVYYEGEYYEGKVYSGGDGEVRRREENWVDNRSNYYLSLYTFDTWYEISPITQYTYRFNSYCSQYY